MTKRLACLSLLCLCLALSGCTHNQQPEHQAYVISIGIDQADAGLLELSIQVPTIGGGGSEGGDSSGSSKYELFTAKAESVPVALDLLKATLPSGLQLSLTKSIVVSEAVARSDAFGKIVDELIMTYRVYGSSAVVVCRGNAKDFLRAQKPSIGIRLSTSVTTALEQHHNTGYVPLTTLYDLFCFNHSLYSDPVLTLAATAAQEQSGAGPMSDRAKAYPGTLPATGPNKNQYMGCALIKDGRMAGILDGQSSRWLSVLRREVDSISYLCDGDALQLHCKGAPRFSLDIAPQGLAVKLSMVLQSTELIEQPNLARLQAQVTRDILALFAQCQQAGVEPFGLAEIGAARFLTAQAFADYRFRDKFCAASISPSIKIEVRVAASRSPKYFY